MSKYQALIDALAGVNGQLGQPSLHSGHVIYAETEEWCSVDINVKLSANKHISGPLARFIKESANPATIRALLADLERAEKALAAIAQQAQPVHQFRRQLCANWYDGHPDNEDGGGPYETRTLYATPPAPQVPAKCITCNGHGLIGGHMPDGSGHGEPCPDCNAPQVPAPVDEEIIAGVLFDFMGWLTSREKRIVLSSADFASPAAEAIRDFAQMRGLDISKAAVRDWQARAALQSPAPQTKGQP